MEKNWLYNEDNNFIVEEGTGEIVMYGDDISPEVLSKIVEMFNNGKTTDDMDSYIVNDTTCTPEGRDFIMENINAYIKMENQQNNQSPDNLDQVKPSDIIIGTEVPPVIITAPESEKKDKRVYQRRVTDGRSSTFKPQSAEDFIKVMQEKIEMARMLDAVTLPEIPGSMTKGNRDIMVEFQKEHAVMVTKYMQKIQQA